MADLVSYGNADRDIEQVSLSQSLEFFLFMYVYICMYKFLLQYTCIHIYVCMNFVLELIGFFFFFVLLEICTQCPLELFIFGVFRN